MNIELLAVAVYVGILLAIGIFSYKKNTTSQDFLIGSRSLNFWLTAFAAHASDMSSWLFMGYPAVVFVVGLYNSWVALGLLFFMFLNWHFIAPKIRMETEKYKSLTFSTYFESRYHDTSGVIRIFTAIMAFFFFSIYISSGLIGLGYLINSLFGINYVFAITAGILIIIPYLFIGGYVTLAWTDLFQALFLLAMIMLVPIVAFTKIGGFEGLELGLTQVKLSLIPSHSWKSYLGIFFLFCGWGLGYFGQPHIITKFMGIKRVSEMHKSKKVGMSWMILTLFFATLIGLIGIPFFKGTLENDQLVFVDMVRNLFPSFFAAIILCAILAATVSTMDSQILVLVSIIAEDLFKRNIKKNATSQEVLLVSRLSIFLIALIAYSIAFFKINTIYNLVSYAWFGLGSSFGPLLIMSLYSKKTNRYGAWAGIFVGGVVSAFWPLANRLFAYEIPTLIPGFSLSLLAIWLISSFTNKGSIYEQKA